MKSRFHCIQKNSNSIDLNEIINLSSFHSIALQFNHASDFSCCVLSSEFESTVSLILVMSYTTHWELQA